MLEIEKTFVVKKLPEDLSSYKSEKIKQGYISSTNPPLRIRQKGNKYELTKKIQTNKNDRSSHKEITIYLNEYEFKKIWPLTEKSLEKTRYLIQLGNNLQAELDVFEKGLDGLSFVEVEFKSAYEMNNFATPEWFGNDVTQEDFSSNFFLAGRTFSEISPLLDKFKK